jgi:hypothetical protein
LPSRRLTAARLGPLSPIFSATQKFVDCAARISRSVCLVSRTSSVAGRSGSARSYIGSSIRQKLIAFSWAKASGPLISTRRSLHSGERPAEHHALSVGSSRFGGKSHLRRTHRVRTCTHASLHIELSMLFSSASDECLTADRSKESACDALTTHHVEQRLPGGKGFDTIDITAHCPSRRSAFSAVTPASDLNQRNLSQRRRRAV